jgi:hypothetical protein
MSSFERMQIDFTRMSYLATTLKPSETPESWRETFRTSVQDFKLSFMEWKTDVEKTQNFRIEEEQ